MVIGGDNMLKKRLTNKQMDVMNILWENDKPMAASEILKANEKLNINTIHACIRKLLEEEYVKVAYIDILCQQFLKENILVRATKILLDQKN